MVQPVAEHKERSDTQPVGPRRIDRYVEKRQVAVVEQKLPIQRRSIDFEGHDEDQQHTRNPVPPRRFPGC